MGHRLSRIYTRTGDDGTTGLGDGSRVTKDSPRIVAGGSVDEANSAIGWLLACDLPDDTRELLTAIQHTMFDIGAEISVPGHALVQDGTIQQLEQQLDALNEGLPPLREFILPGGGEAASRCHMARTIVRRAERDLVCLSRTDAVRRESLTYLNRLSDLLFVVARVLARGSDQNEQLWNHERTHKQT